MEINVKNFLAFFQGDRFGGALDAAAKQFSKAFDSGMLPMEFVNKMKKDGKLIMGIGHRVKSVSTVAACHVCIQCGQQQSDLKEFSCVCKKPDIKQKEGTELPVELEFNAKCLR